MNSKIFVGSVKESKYGVVVGLRTGDLEKLAGSLNDKGWVNLGVSKSKAGKWYAEIVQFAPKVETAETEEGETPF